MRYVSVEMATAHRFIAAVSRLVFERGGSRSTGPSATLSKVLSTAPQLSKSYLKGMPGVSNSMACSGGLGLGWW